MVVFKTQNNRGAATAPAPNCGCMTSTIDRRRLLGTVLIATFIGQFDFFVVNVAAPGIQTSLGAGNTALELVVAGYAFMYAAGLVTGGRLGDLLGRRRVFIAGLTAFAVTSALCGLAPNAGVLIACRVMQGLSAAVMLPQALAFINTVVAPERRGWAMGWFGVASGVGSIAGQGLGGLPRAGEPLGPRVAARLPGERAHHADRHHRVPPLSAFCVVAG